MALLCRMGLYPLMCFLLLMGCDRSKPSQSINKAGSFEIALPLPKIVVEQVSWVEYLVVADGDSLRGNLNIGEDGVARGSIRGISAGPARLLRLSAFNELGNLTYAGATTTDVAPDQMVRVHIVMKATQPTGGLVDPPDTVLVVDPPDTVLVVDPPDTVLVVDPPDTVLVVDPPD
ncbi:MAG: hypothetical protein ACI8PG_000108, partial [Planctomycetota bacterium]